MVLRHPPGHHEGMDLRTSSTTPSLPVLLTPDALEAHERELARLKRVHRGYHGIGPAEAARGERDTLQELDREHAVTAARIVELESLLRTATVLGAEAPDLVAAGLVVDVRYENAGRSASYLVTAAARPEVGSVSIHSPIGAALVGRRVGDVVQVELPNGSRETLSILAVRPAEAKAA